MKITILGTAYPYRGGLATFNERLARQFMAEGHEVKVLTFTLQYPSFLFPGTTQFSEEKAPEGLHIERALNSCNPFNWRKVGRMVRNDAPDLLICCYWMAFMAPAFGTVCRMAARNGKTRCVALVHNMFPHEKSLLDRLFAPYFAKAQTAFVALSESVVRDINTLSPKTPKAFFPHPIYDHYGDKMTKEEACKALGLDPTLDYALFFGLVRAYKGLDLLVEAMGKVKDQLPNLRVLVAGEFYEDEEKYTRQIAQCGVADRIIVRNAFIPDADLRKYFGAADLIAQPYRSATQSGVTQVAFHFEKPMLVTNVGGLPEIVHHGEMGYAVRPDASEIAASLLDFFLHDRKDAFVACVQQEKKKYAWDNMTAAFYRLLEK